MRIVQINTTCGIGSPGKICIGISQLLTDRSAENYILCSTTNGYALGIPCATPHYIMSQATISRISGRYGFQSRTATRRIIRELDRIQPNIVHLHNIHGHDCHIGMLFSYLKKHKIKLVWTFHDCWAFTAYCPYFVRVNCDKWKEECSDCPQYRDYSMLFDRSRELYQEKKELFAGLDLTIATPSQWLAGLVKQSFLKDYPVTVVNNGIDLSVFRPRENDFRSKYGIPSDKHILLGVAFGWGIRKGLDVFVQLSKILDPDKYQIVLVGTTEKVDQQLPSSIISIHSTQNQLELAEIYSASDLLLNPTREDNYPTTHMEALACGTPVLTFQTGGASEMLDETCGATVPCGDIEAFRDEILRICEERVFSFESCLRKAKEFDQNQKFKEYIDLYERINASGD